MTSRLLVAPVAITAAMTVALSSFALSPQHEEWAKGPASYLMTKDEIAKWKTLSSDDEAAKFVALFWARRDPTPGTPHNEFREQFETRVKYADEKLPGPDKKRGSMTDRGKTLILLGGPTKVLQAGQQREGALPSGISSPDAAPVQPPFDTRSGDDSAMPLNLPGSEAQVWVYEGDAAKAIFNVPKAEVRFVDRHGKSDFRIARGSVDYAGAEKRAIERAIAQPNLTEAPLFERTIPASQIVPAAPVMQTELMDDSLKSAVAAFKTSGKSEKPVYVSTGEYVTAEGETFVPVLMYVPKGVGASGEAKRTFFGVVEDASGKPVLAFEHDAKLVASKDDFYVDRSLTLPAGKHRGYFGIAENGKVIAVTSADLDLAGKLDKDAPAVSQLILSNNVYPLTEAQQATDPYAFGGIKVVPKADCTFRTSDELGYFVELRNPGLSEGESPAPNIQVKLDITGKEDGPNGRNVKRGSPPLEVEAAPVKGVPGHYFIGRGLPLDSFKPGEYTFTVKIIDTVKKTSHTLSEKFRVVE